MADTMRDEPTVVASAVPVDIAIVGGADTPGGPATGTVTPALSELPPDQVEHSLKVSLADLCAKAAVLYSQQKNYEEAAEVYARAAEIQAEMNGETNPENAEILFLYGRALFKVGQGKSDVLGGKAPETGAPLTDKAKGAEKKDVEEKEKAAAPIAAAIASAGSSGSGPSTADAGATAEEKAALDAKKPLFQFTGDEEWDASDDEDAAEGEGAEEGEEEDDDLAVAFEILDLSRVLFEKQLEQKKEAGSTTEAVAAASEEKGKEKEAESEEAKAEEESAENKLEPSVRHIMERLADTHDLLAEISLENERYPNAIVDSRASLAYKQKFLTEESEIIAEAHFKLSLALEFASVTTATEEGEGANSADKKDQQVDQELRDESALELEAAIASTRLKLQNREVELATMHSPEDNESTRRQIAEVKEIIADMEQRLVDLKKPPIDLNAAVNGPAAAAVGGLLGALASGNVTGASVEEAKKGAKDLTGLVRKRAKDAASGSSDAAAASTTDTTTTTNGNGIKRKAEEPAADEEENKKARTDDESSS